MPVFTLSEAELRTRTSLKWQTYGPDVLPLWVAEMDVRQHPAVTDVLTEALERGDTGYPVGTTYPDAYRAMAERCWGWAPDADHVHRSGDVMNAILAILLGNTRTGDRVALNPPVYPPFWQVVEGYRRRPAPVPLTPEGRLDLAGLAECFGGPDAPAAYLLCSPHNPRCNAE